MPDGTLRAFVNGAPGALLERCAALYTGSGTRPLTDQDRAEILALTSGLADSALRVIGSAMRDLGAVPLTNLEADAVERDLVFVGLTGMYDPPRPEAKAAIAKCRAAGIRVVMITGDHPRTAVALAPRARHRHGPRGRDGPGTRGPARRRTPQTRAGHRRLRAGDRGPQAAHRPGPEGHRRRRGHDRRRRERRPAISGADIGIAMGKSGTEVTRQAADMIITDDNFATIVAAVEEGRGIYDNIRKTLQYLLAGNTGELLLMTACVAANLPSPLLPIHLLWINLVTDGLPALCLATDPIDPGVMTRAPRPRSEPITDRRFLRTMVFTGVLTAGVALGVYVSAFEVGHHGGGAHVGLRGAGVRGTAAVLRRAQRHHAGLADLALHQREPARGGGRVRWHPDLEPPQHDARRLAEDVDAAADGQPDARRRGDDSAVVPRSGEGRTTRPPASRGAHAVSAGPHGGGSRRWPGGVAIWGVANRTTRRDRDADERRRIRSGGANAP